MWRDRWLKESIVLQSYKFCWHAYCACCLSTEKYALASVLSEKLWNMSFRVGKHVYCQKWRFSEKVRLGKNMSI